MKTKIGFGLLIGCLMVLSLPGFSQRNIATFNAHPIECLGVEMDGSQTLKTWGTGRNRFDAVEQAKKNAVNEVLFKGIRGGRPDCEVKPVLAEVNVRDKNEAYFNKFFADGGDFKDFISLKDERLGHRILREKEKATTQVSQSVIVRVDRAGLIEKMKEDGILK